MSEHVTNHSFDYQPLMGPEPKEWTQWMAWHRRLAKLFPGSNGTIDEAGRVYYRPLLKSQRTRRVKEVPKCWRLDA